jgi:hypothetical protein
VDRSRYCHLRRPEGQVSIAPSWVSRDGQSHPLISSHVRRHLQTLTEARLTRQGIYSIIIDSAPPQYFSGLADPNIFQQVLFATSTLAQGDHTLRITNEGNRDAPDQPGLVWLDVDFVAFSGAV